MKIEKAIEILHEHKDNLCLPPSIDLKDAISLSIEALKRHQSQRKYPYCVIMEPLPGETED